VASLPNLLRFLEGLGTFLLISTYFFLSQTISKNLE
jgi:hypothetical protein